MITAGIEEILIVTGIEHMGDVVNLLGSGKDFGCRFTYKVQDEAGGIAQALGLAENFAAGQPVLVILGDNIFQSDLKNYAKKFISQKNGAMVLLKQVDDPQRFGVAELNGDKVIGIEEKPKSPKSNLAVIGVYFYDSAVFDIIRTLKPSHRGELEVTDINNAYIKNNKMAYDVIDGWWSDAGTFESLAKVNQLIAQQGEI